MYLENVNDFSQNLVFECVVKIVKQERERVTILLCGYHMLWCSKLFQRNVSYLFLNLLKSPRKLFYGSFNE